MDDVAHLEDLLLDTKDGDWGVDEPAVDHVPHRVIRGADFPSSRVGDTISVPLRFLPSRSVWRRVLQPNDILFETAGGTRDRPTGRTLRVTQELLASFDNPVIGASFTRFLRPDPSKVNPAFLFWYLQYLYAVGDMYEYQVQHTGVARFQYTTFAATKELRLLPVSRQEPIASLLNSLDDKIGADSRALSSIERLSEAQYARAVGSSTSRAPLSDLLTLNYGKALPATSRTGGAVAVYGSGGVVGSHNKPLVEGPGVVLGRKGSVGSTYWADGPHFPIDTTYYVLPRSYVPAELLYYMLKEIDFAAMNSDSAVPGLNRDQAYSVSVKVPDAERCVELGREIQERFSFARAIRHEVCCLTDILERLLPALVTGALSVRAAEALVDEVV